MGLVGIDGQIDVSLIIVRVGKTGCLWQSMVPIDRSWCCYLCHGGTMEYPLNHVYL